MNIFFEELDAVECLERVDRFIVDELARMKGKQDVEEFATLVRQLISEIVDKE